MKESFFNRTFLWYGIYYGVTSIILFVLEYFLAPDLMQNKIVSSLVFLVPLILFMTLAGIAEKKKNDGYLSFSKTFQCMFYTATIGLVMISVFNYMFTTFYAPEFMTEIYEKQMAETRIKLEEQGMADEDIDKTMELTEKIFKLQDRMWFKLIGVLMLIGMGAIAALLNALVIRKNPPTDYFVVANELEKEN